MAHYSEAKGSGHSGKKLDHLRIMRGMRGKGHVVEHHYESSGMAYHKPDQVPFSDGEGKAMLAHVAQHMGVDAESPAEDAEEGSEEA